MPKLLLIDGTALVFRAFYGIRNPMINSQGLQTNAIYGFFNILFKTLMTYQPDYFAVCFDRSEPTRRHKQYDDYKANRTKAPDELYSQIPIIKHILKEGELNLIEYPGFEADDIIATIDTKNNKDNLETLIYSADFDLLQLVSKYTKVIIPSSKEEKIITPEKFLEKHQIKPTQVPDLKGLSGDSSDNLPGVKGIGPKTATKLLLKYETLENIYSNIDQIKGSNKEKLVKDKQIALLCKNLAKLDYNAPVSTQLDDYSKHNINLQKIQDEFQKIEFNRLIQRSNQLQRSLNIEKVKIDKKQASLF
jgi:DNA polymerase-1